MKNARAPSLQPKRRFSQNFLTDTRTAQRIVSAADIRESDTVIEIGCGRGALTRWLLETGATIHGVEIDRDMIRILQENYGTHPRFELHAEDFLQWPLEQVAPSVKIIGNLPYHISSPILFKLIDHRDRIQSATIMVQKEVALRIVGKPDSKDYGILSVISQLHADCKKLFDIPAGSFYPKPSVVSSVVQLVFRPDDPAIPDPKWIRTVVRTAFNQRRKMLRNSLSELMTGEIDFDLEKRPEHLSVAQFIELARKLFAARTE